MKNSKPSSPLKPPRTSSPGKNRTLISIDENSLVLDSRSDFIPNNSQILLTKENHTYTKLDYSSMRASFFPNHIPSPLLTLTKTKTNLAKTRKSTIHFINPIPTHYSDNDIPIAMDQETEEEMFVCINHNNSKILLHCSDCNMPLCIQCMKTHHQDKRKHEYIEINELKEKISLEAHKQIELLEERVQNLEPEFNLDEIQQVGLKAINESKEQLLKIIDDFYDELIKNYNSLTYKKPISLQKTAILDKQKELMESLQKFKKPDFHINFIAEYFKNQYIEEVKSLEENINSFQMKIRKEFRRLPSIKKNLDVLKDFQDMLLNYIHISFGTQKPEISMKGANSPPPNNANSTNLQGSSVIQVRNIIDKSSYFKTTKKYLHYLFPVERRLFLYDIDTHKSLLYPLGNFDYEIPAYSSTIFTPELDLYILGGFYQKSKEYSNKIFKYDKEQGLLTLSPMFKKKMAFGICYIKGLIYIFGGKSKDTDRLDLCERYSIKTNKWEPIGKMKEKRASPGVCSFNDEKVFVFFGTNPLNPATDMIEKYNIKKNSWSSIYVVNWLNGFEMSQITCQQINCNQILLFGGVNRLEKEETGEKFYKFSKRMIIFDIQDRNFENLGDSLPQGSLNLGQSFVENNHLYSLRTIKNSGDNQFENAFAVLEINEHLKATYINMINCKDVKMIMRLQKHHEKME